MTQLAEQFQGMSLFHFVGLLWGLIAVICFGYAMFGDMTTDSRASFAFAGLVITAAACFVWSLQ